MTTLAFLLVIAVAAGAVAFYHERDNTKDRLLRLKDEFEAGMEVQGWTAGHRGKLEDMVAELERLDPQGGAWSRQLLHWTLAARIGVSLRKPPVDHPEARRSHEPIKEAA